MIDEREIQYRTQFYRQDLLREKEQRRLRRLALASRQPRVIGRGFDLWGRLKWPFRRTTQKTAAPAVIADRCQPEGRPI
ncbi:MAG TPA: hypothetical protein VHO69_16825 [Phototrophicaceae bacterium]|nr:hypothetical protein [Phototrophicaceae bacterium]